MDLEHCLLSEYSAEIERNLPGYAGRMVLFQSQKESQGKGPGRSWETSGDSQSLESQCRYPCHPGMEGQTCHLKEEGRVKEEISHVALWDTE